MWSIINTTDIKNNNHNLPTRKLKKIIFFLSYNYNQEEQFLLLIYSYLKKLQKNISVYKVQKAERIAA